MLGFWILRLLKFSAAVRGGAKDPKVSGGSTCSAILFSARSPSCGVSRAPGPGARGQRRGLGSWGKAEDAISPPRCPAPASRALILGFAGPPFPRGPSLFSPRSCCAAVCTPPSALCALCFKEALELCPWASGQGWAGGGWHAAPGQVAHDPRPCFTSKLGGLGDPWDHTRHKSPFYAQGRGTWPSPDRFPAVLSGFLWDSHCDGHWCFIPY